MNASLQRELSAVTGLLSLGAYALGFRKTAQAGAIGALGLLASSMVRDFNFKAKNVFITGGSRGLGLSIAWNVLARGGSVMLAARDADELEDAQDKLLRDFPEGRVYIYACDVTDRHAIAECLDNAIAEMGGIDVLVNNAGAILVGPLTSMEPEDFEAQMRLHLHAAVNTTQLILPHFRTRAGGRILNICSLGGKAAVPHMLPYDASKFALAGFSQGAAAELARYNVKVTVAYPTVMRTGSPIQAVFKGEHEKEYRWFAVGDNMPGFAMSAHSAANKVLDAVADGRTEIILSSVGKLRNWVGAFFPETMHAVMTGMAAALPTGDSLERKTGAQSAALVEKSKMLAPIRANAKRAEATYNQEPRHDADFNLGLPN